MSVAWFVSVKRGPSYSPPQGDTDGHSPLTGRLAETEEAMTVLFCRTDDTYALLNPGARHYESLKRLSDSEILTLALLQQLRGVESERSFLRESERFFSHLFPGVVGYAPSPRFTDASGSSGASSSLSGARSSVSFGRRPRDAHLRLDAASGLAPPPGEAVGFGF